MIEQAKLREYESSPLAFINDLVIPGVHGPARFGDCMAEFQREWFSAVIPSLIAVSNGNKPPIGRFWVERTKGASKDSDLACCLLWLMIFSRRNLTIQAGANDRDQADELRKAARDIIKLNVWIEEFLTIQAWRILNEHTGTECKIITADASGSHGARPHVLIVNELSHIQQQAFAQTLMDNADKMPHGVVLIATNAGFTPSWQLDWRSLFKSSSRWHFHQYSQPSPWLDDAAIEEAKRRNPSSRFNRLFKGIWSSQEGTALPVEDVEACITLSHPTPMATERISSKAYFLSGLDLGVRHDHAALCTIGVWPDLDGMFLADCQSWKPEPGGQVDLREVRDAVCWANHRFGLQGCAYDPHQAELLAQDCAAAGVCMWRVPFTVAMCDEMATTLLRIFATRRINLYRDADLIADLFRLKIIERNLGFRLQATRDPELGHCDRATALALTLPVAERLMAELRAGAGSEEIYT